MRYVMYLGVATALAALSGCSDTPSEPDDGGSEGPSLALSEVTVDRSALFPGDTAIVTVTTMDTSGVTITEGGATVTLSLGGGTSAFTLSTVVDRGNGTYEAHVVGVQAGTPITLSALVNGEPLTSDPPSLTVVRFVDVVSGDAHACGLSSIGEVYCWGANMFGQLGRGYQSGNSDRMPFGQRVQASVALASLSSGGTGTCGLTAAGEGYCWGAQPWGNRDSVPYRYPNGETLQVLQSGSEQTCWVTTAGTAYCYGNNHYGGVGDGTRGKPRAPVAVAGGHVFRSVDPAETFTCGVTADHVGLCWGFNLYGQAGVGAYDTVVALPDTVAGGIAFAAIVGGSEHNCGLSTTGSAHCWGSAMAVGRSDVGSPSAVPVTVTGGHTFTSVSAGGYTTCGLTGAGGLYCWGVWVNGWLDGGTIQQEPAAVFAGHIVTSVGVGSVHACLTASDGVAYCWGSNQHGALGDGTAADSDTPVRVVLR